ncbi:unnamed protein product [Larinioides sclopetarius]|uniref:GPI ethanolamine phosphate transferase 1 n=1 Tax=Larinioides sclopetarius TaxID=280406 RepID=A0AAV1ZUX6_9ARAC
MIVFGVLSIAIHTIFLYSVFDIYFKSPIIHGMTPYSTPLPAPAKRLVLFVADGMRADKFFEISEAGETNSPFLRDIITNVGAWGVSHTRVPTESRPGHVALIGGIYEDVSAVTKGWKENPVEFDSVFNESRYTWAWGSPDILPMFSKGIRENVFIDTYTSAEEDFAAASPYSLDEWVFQKLEKFFDEARVNATLKNMLFQDKNILFLHLLGMDISGHSYKPGSQEYIKNTQVVDAGIQKCVHLIDSFFENDGKTAFIFTSDHGMTDWGSHGSGDMHETYTPFVAWGAGIRGPLGEGKDFYHDGLSDEWKLTQVKRVDINQVDVAPLISTLIGIPFPVNSLGILPVEYLGTEWPHKALSLLTNARQILANYQRQMLQKKENTLPIFFWRFKELSSSRQAELMAMIDTLLKQNRYKDVIQVGLKIIELALKGLVYYQKHDRIILSLSIFLAFLGWISYVFVLILKDYTSFGQKSLESSVIIPEDNFSRIKCIISFVFIGSFISLLLYVQNAPVMYYAYFLLPVLLWMLVCLQWELIYSSKLHLERKNNFYKFIGLSLLSFIAMEFLVISFFKREVLSVVLWGIAVWPFFSSLTNAHKRLCLSWCVTSIILSGFPMMAVVGKDTNYNTVILAGWLFIFAVGFCARRPETGLIFNSRTVRREPYHIAVITAVQVVLLCVSTYTIQSTSRSIANKDGLPFLNQIVAWFILGISLVLPMFGSQSILTRLLNVMTSLFAPYILLSISHEGMFCLLLCIEMILWLMLEHHLSYNYSKLQDIHFVPISADPMMKKINMEISLGDFRRAYFFDLTQENQSCMQWWILTT